MKKIMLAFLLTFFVSAGAITQAAELPKLTLAATTAADSKTIELTVDLSKSSDVFGCSFELVYENAKLAYAKHEATDIMKDASLVVNEKYAANTVRVVWAGANALPQDGAVLRFTFNVTDGSGGECDFTVSNLKMADQDGAKVDCSSEDTKGKLVVFPKPQTGGGSSSSSSSGGGGGSAPVASSGTTEKAPEKEAPEAVISPEDDFTLELFSFSDVTENDWFYESVRFVREKNLMSGVSETEFAPNSELTRAMLVTILHRLENSPESGAPLFDDVADGKWFSAGIAWAAEKKVVSGVGNNRFAPENSITREQIALIFYNYAKLRGLDVTAAGELSAFADGEAVSEWAQDAMRWAVGSGLITGKDGGRLDAFGDATRAEISTIFMRFVKALPSA